MLEPFPKALLCVAAPRQRHINPGRPEPSDHMEPPVGIEPTTTHYKGVVLPLNYGGMFFSMTVGT
jgi:hypothetical protein